MSDHNHIEKPCKIIIIFLILSPDFWYVTDTALVCNKHSLIQHGEVDMLLVGLNRAEP